MTNSDIVAKIGSSQVTCEHGIDQEAIDYMAAGLAETYANENLVVVTSGAVAAGRIQAEQLGVDTSEYSYVTLAQLGVSSVMRAWEVAFAKVGRTAGGLLVTHHEIDDWDEGRYFKDALDLAKRQKVISVVNANDSLSNDEVLEDNDWLASHIARSIHADELTLFTKRGGIIDDHDNLIDCVDLGNKEAVRTMLVHRAAKKADQKKVGDGKGGMIKKFDAGWKAAEAGVHTKIAAINANMTGDKITKLVA